MQADVTDAGIRRYLLGLLDEPEAEALEELYFAEPDVLARVRGMEDDLLDDYVAGRLAAADRKAFESRYLTSPRLRERVVAARALRLATGSEARAQATAGTGRRRWRGALAIAAGLLLAAAAALWLQPPRPEQVTTARARRPRQTARSRRRRFLPSPGPLRGRSRRARHIAWSWRSLPFSCEGRVGLRSSAFQREPRRSCWSWKAIGR